MDVTRMPVEAVDIDYGGTCRKHFPKEDHESRIPRSI